MRPILHSPLEQEDIETEMVKVAKRFNSDDLLFLIDIMFEIDNEELLAQYEALMSYYIQYNEAEVGSKLINQLVSEGPWQIISLVGYTKNVMLYHDLIAKVDYSKLDKEAKFSLIDAFDFLKNKDAIKYLNNLENIETDPEILEEIGLVIHNLNL